MAMRLLVDADFLIALAKKDDANHRVALTEADELRDAVLFITSFTIPEAATVLSYKVSQSAARNFLKAVREKNFFELPLERRIIAEADSIFLSQNKKGVSWIDCYNVAVARIHALDAILSFDKFYRKFGLSYTASHL